MVEIGEVGGRPGPRRAMRWAPSGSMGASIVLTRTGCWYFGRLLRSGFFPVSEEPGLGRLLKKEADEDEGDVRDGRLAG